MANKKNGTSKDHKEQNTDKDLINTHIQNSLNLKCKNASQKEFINLINQKEITFGYGCSGTGKSYLSIFKAFQLLKNPNNKFKKIIVAKPIVDVEESIGFLPGSELEKLRPYVMSSIEIMNRIVGSGTRQKLEENDFIEFIALAHIRGMNIENSIMIMEEAQNMSPLQMKTLLTRIGKDSKYIINGDLDQSDRYKNVKDSGLYDALEKHSNIEEIGMHEFHKDDIVRNPLITKILDNY